MNDEESRARIAAVAPEAVCICAFGALIREPLLSEHEMLNVHPSLLPRWRGAAPIERAIEAGDETTGVTIMRPTADWDAGPICIQRAEPIHADDDYGTLAARLAALGGELLVEALDDPPPWRDQPDQGVTYAEKIGPDDRRLDPSRPADELERRVRALTPHVGAYVELPSDERLGVRRAALAPDGADVEEGALRADDGPPRPGDLDGRARAARGAAAGRPPDGRRRLPPRPPGGHLRLRPPASGYGCPDSRCPRPPTKPPQRSRNAQPAASPPCAAPTCRAATAASTACAASSSAPAARTAAPTPRSPACRTPRTWTAAAAARRCWRRSGVWPLGCAPAGIHVRVLKRTRPGTPAVSARG